MVSKLQEFLPRRKTHALAGAIRISALKPILRCARCCWGKAIKDASACINIGPDGKREVTYSGYAWPKRKLHRT